MACPGQAHAHSAQPMLFSSPSGQRFNWRRRWKRGAVGFLTSGYWTVSTFENIWWKATPNPLTGFRKSVRPTGDLLTRDSVVRRGKRRDGEAARHGIGWPRRGLFLHAV